METGLHPMNYLAGVSETTSEILTTMAQRWKHRWGRPGCSFENAILGHDVKGTGRGVPTWNRPVHWPHERRYRTRKSTRYPWFWISWVPLVHPDELVWRGSIWWFSWVCQTQRWASTAARWTSQSTRDGLCASTSHRTPCWIQRRLELVPHQWGPLFSPSFTDFKRPRCASCWEPWIAIWIFGSVDDFSSTGCFRFYSCPTPFVFWDKIERELRSLS